MLGVADPGGDDAGAAVLLGGTDIDGDADVDCGGAGDVGGK